MSKCRATSVRGEEGSYERLCGICKQWFPQTIQYFYRIVSRQNERTHPYVANCIKCTRARRKEYDKKNRERINAAQRVTLAKKNRKRWEAFELLSEVNRMFADIKATGNIDILHRRIDDLQKRINFYVVTEEPNAEKSRVMNEYKAKRKLMSGKSV